MDANKMWDMIAELVKTYADEGDRQTAMTTLAQALDAEPMWIPQARFDPRVAALRDLPDFREKTALPPDDGPAHFNAAIVALEHGERNAALDLFRKTFEIAREDGSLPFLLEAVHDEATLQSALSDAAFSAVIEPYHESDRDAAEPS